MEQGIVDMMIASSAVGGLDSEHFRILETRRGRRVTGNRSRTGLQTTVMLHAIRGGDEFKPTLESQIEELSAKYGIKDEYLRSMRELRSVYRKKPDSAITASEANNEQSTGTTNIFELRGPVEPPTSAMSTIFALRKQLSGSRKRSKSRHYRRRSRSSSCSSSSSSSSCLSSSSSSSSCSSSSSSSSSSCSSSGSSSCGEDKLHSDLLELLEQTEFNVDNPDKFIKVLNRDPPKPDKATMSTFAKLKSASQPEVERILLKHMQKLEDYYDDLAEVIYHLGSLRS